MASLTFAFSRAQAALTSLAEPVSHALDDKLQSFDACMMRE
jgi:hypothetical protein